MKVLFFPFCPGPALAHAGACLAIAEVLASRGAEIVFAYGGSRPDLVQSDGIRVIRVDEVPVAQLGDHDDLGKFFNGPDDLIERIEADRATIEAEDPDVVVIDMRFPAVPAAELAGVPTVTVNHFFSNSKLSALSSTRRRLGMLRHPLAAMRGLVGMLDRDRLGARRLGETYAAARKRLGLPPGEGLPFSGPCTALTTTPFLDPPVAPLPKGFHFVGPVTWSATGGVAPPTDRSRPLVFVSQGSLPAKSALAEIPRALKGLDTEIAVVTMGAVDPEEVEALGPGITALEFVDNDAWLEAADVAVLHGGHLSTSAAARAGTPVVVIPDGRDHWAWAAKVRRMGTGIPLYRPLLPGAIGRATRKVLTDPRFTERAAWLAGELEHWNGQERTANLIEQVAAEPHLGFPDRPST